MAKNIIMGVDPASFKNMGLCVGRIQKNGKLKILERFTKVFDVDKNTKDSRFIDLKETVRDIIQRKKVDILIFERTQFGKPFIMSQIYETIGVIKLICQEEGVRIVEISPSTIKLAITGYGRSSKPEVMKAVMKEFNLSKKDLSSDHEADAIGVCQAYIQKR